MGVSAFLLYSFIWEGEHLERACPLSLYMQITTEIKHYPIYGKEDRINAQPAFINLNSNNTGKDRDDYTLLFQGEIITSRKGRNLKQEDEAFPEGV